MNSYFNIVRHTLENYGTYACNFFDWFKMAMGFYGLSYLIDWQLQLCDLISWYTSQLFLRKKIPETKMTLITLGDATTVPVRLKIRVWDQFRMNTITHSNNPYIVAKRILKKFDSDHTEKLDPSEFHRAYCDLEYYLGS